MKGRGFSSINVHYHACTYRVTHNGEKVETTVKNVQKVIFLSAFPRFLSFLPSRFLINHFRQKTKFKLPIILSKMLLVPFEDTPVQKYSTSKYNNCQNKKGFP